MSDFNSANFTVVPTPVADPLSGSRPSVHTDIGPVGELWSPFSSISTLGCCVMRCQGSWCHGAISEMSLSLHPLLWHRLCLSRLCSLFNGCGARGSLCSLSTLCWDHKKRGGFSLPRPQGHIHASNTTPGCCCPVVAQGPPF